MFEPKDRALYMVAVKKSPKELEETAAGGIAPGYRL